MKLAWLAFSLYWATAGLATAQSDPASTFPSKPIRWIVGFAPGASNDLIARIVATRLTELWGRQIVIDNRPGAGGMIGGEKDARGTPGGYTGALAARGADIRTTLRSQKSRHRGA